jgi:ferredoxin/flavodoxin
MEHVIAYFSPAGSTRLVAETIHRRLSEQGYEGILYDLGADRRAAKEKHALILGPCCLWIGSPVYCDHAVPLVTDFIEALPSAAAGSYTVPFVTWGGVTSGLALYEMAGHLQEKDYTVVAAAKVLAVHSSMWRASQPLAAGHPDADDLAQINWLVDEVIRILKSGKVVALDRGVLDYLSPSVRAEAVGKSLEAVKAAMPPLRIDEQRCQQCGECTAACPVAALTLAPWPKSTDACVLCLQCIRACPQDAFVFDSEAVSARIAAMAAESDEVRTTRIFC